MQGRESLVIDLVNKHPGPAAQLVVGCILVHILVQDVFHDCIVSPLGCKVQCGLACIVGGNKVSAFGEEVSDDVQMTIGCGVVEWRSSTNGSARIRKSGLRHGSYTFTEIACWLPGILQGVLFAWG